MDAKAVIDALPALKGAIESGVALAPYTWFRVGGPADFLFRPADEDDLCTFLQAVKNVDLPVQIIGVGSNLLVRDGGVDGVVIRLGKAFGQISIDEAAHQITVGAAALDGFVAEQAARAGIGGLEFLRGIPGTIGGALTMNAGAYGAETKDILVRAHAVDFAGNKVELTPEEMDFSYRRSNPGKPLIFTGAVLQGHADDPDAIRSRMGDIMAARDDSQPVRERTGGSTFKNPDMAASGGRKSWQLIDEAGCRGLRIRNAMVSNQHCNFLINTGEAKAADLEELGETVRKRVLDATGVSLNWEIRRIGRTTLEGDRGE